MADDTAENQQAEAEAEAEAKAAAADAEQALEAVEAEAAAELPASDEAPEGLAQAKAAAADAEQALEAVEAEAATELPAGAEAAAPGGDGARANRRKVREGMVVSDAMAATVVVAVVERVRHPKYGKTVQRTKKLYVHDAENTAKVGDRVRVQETRPRSKLKRWRLTEVVERAR
jgi:small subunit ribosomal protein S17